MAKKNLVLIQTALLVFGMVIIACSDSGSDNASELPTQLYISLDNKTYITEHDDGSTSETDYNYGKPGTHYKYEGNGDIIFALYDDEGNRNIFTAGKIQNGYISLDLPTNIPPKYFREKTISLVDGRSLVAVIPDIGACTLGLMDSEQQFFAFHVYVQESSEEYGLNFSKGWNIIYVDNSIKITSTDSKIIKREMQWYAGRCRSLPPDFEW